MTKSSSQDMEGSQPSQQYDTTLKDWVRQDVVHVLPLLLPGAVYEETLTIELIRPTIRADKAFKIMYKEKDIITFHFQMLPLFTLEAEEYVRKHIVSMYPLLPTMQGANRTLIKQAVSELVELYREDEVTLAQQIIWMELLLERTDTVPLSEKRGIKEELKVYDPLWEENPKIRRIRAESKAEGLAEGKAKGLAEGKAEGLAEGLQIALVSAVKVRFPELTELAQQKVGLINDTSNLDMLLKHVITAPDANIARWLLTSAA